MVESAAKAVADGDLVEEAKTKYDEVFGGKGKGVLNMFSSAFVCLMFEINLQARLQGRQLSRFRSAGHAANAGISHLTAPVVEMVLLLLA